MISGKTELFCITNVLKIGGTYILNELRKDDWGVFVTLMGDVNNYEYNLEHFIVLDHIDISELTKRININ